MKKSTFVKIRENNDRKRVPITNDKKPVIEQEMLERWQRIINLVAKILKVPAGLIMRITEDSMIVFLKSQNPENPYPERGSDSLGHGLYCETVIGEDRELLVPNALKNKKWKDNPDVKLNMISYYGLPIKWEDDEFFGTICVLDSDENVYNNDYKDLLNEFKVAIESDLRTLMYKDELRYYAEMDIMTSSYNRNKIEEILTNEFERSKRYGETFSLAIMDIDKLKQINDDLGHIKGDEIIKVFADSINSRIRTVDSFGRWGGDEFILLCPNTDITSINTLMKDITRITLTNMQEVVPEASFCYGCAEYNEEDNDYYDIIKRADKELYKEKDKLK